MDGVSVANRFTALVLSSPAHRLLSGSTDLVRYVGRRSGRTITTPTQYVAVDDGYVILVAHPDTKAWWRNFTAGGDAELLLAGVWLPVRARAVRGADEPDVVGPLLDRYLERFPRAASVLGSDDRADRVRAAVVVHCTPR